MTAESYRLLVVFVFGSISAAAVVSTLSRLFRRPDAPFDAAPATEAHARLRDRVLLHAATMSDECVAEMNEVFERHHNAAAAVRYSPSSGWRCRCSECKRMERQGR